MLRLNSSGPLVNALIVNAGNVHRLGHAVYKRDADAFSVIRLENCCHFVGRFWHMRGVRPRDAVWPQFIGAAGRRANLRCFGRQPARTSHPTADGIH